MTGSRIVLDTSIVIAWLKGDQIIADKIDEAGNAYIPIFVLGELYYGAQYSIWQTLIKSQRTMNY